MAEVSALDTINALIAARKNHDMDAAFACYEPDATVVLQPGQTGRGEAAIRAFILGTSALVLSFDAHEIIESGDCALHLSRYTLDNGDQGVIKGRTADVLRRRPDGSWRIVIDNAWVG